jgi:flagellar motility protein MotE (MotC chaperone)
MKPDKAAEVLSVQESDIAVRILQAIDSKKASKIFNFMDKEISAKLQRQYLLMKK